MWYWHEIATFSKVGLKCGHYGFEGLAAPAAHLGLGTYGAHSLWFPALYGTIGNVVGFEYHTGIYINLCLLTLALVCMVLLMRGSVSFLLFCAAFLCTGLFITFYFPLLMMEAFQYVLVFLLAGLFYRRLTSQGDNSKWLSRSLWAVILFAAFTRYTWALLFFAYYVPAQALRSPRAWLTSLAKGLGCFILGYLGYTLFAAPYPYEPFPGGKYGLGVYLSLLRSDPAPLLYLLRTNIKGVFSPETVTPYMLLLWMVMLYSFALPLLAFFEKGEEKKGAQQRFTLTYFHVVNLLGTQAALFFYYFTTVGMAGLRHAMPHFTCSLLIAARWAGVRWLLPVLAVQLAVFPAIMLECQVVMNTNYDMSVKKSTEAMVRELFEKIQYESEVSSPWCNTVLFFGCYNVGSSYMFVPRGLAINDMRAPSKPELLAPLRARWVVSSEPVAKKILDSVEGVQSVASQGAWTLYINNKAGCRP